MEIVYGRWVQLCTQERTFCFAACCSGKKLVLWSSFDESRLHCVVLCTTEHCDTRADKTWRWDEWPLASYLRQTDVLLTLACHQVHRGGRLDYGIHCRWQPAAQFPSAKHRRHFTVRAYHPRHLHRLSRLSLHGAPMKSSSLRSFADKWSTVKANFVIFCVSIDRLY